MLFLSHYRQTGHSSVNKTIVLFFLFMRPPSSLLPFITLSRGFAASLDLA
jgi:hypothetical protein